MVDDSEATTGCISRIDQDNELQVAADAWFVCVLKGCCLAK